MTFYLAIAGLEGSPKVHGQQGAKQIVSHHAHQVSDESGGIWGGY